MSRFICLVAVVLIHTIMCDIINSVNFKEFTAKYESFQRPCSADDSNNAYNCYKDHFIDKLDNISNAGRFFLKYFTVLALNSLGITVLPPILDVLYNLEYLDISENHLRAFADHRKSWRRIKSINIRYFKRDFNYF